MFPINELNDLVNGRRGVTPSTALRLAKFFDNTPDFWLNLQLRWDSVFCRETRNSYTRNHRAAFTFKAVSHLI